MTAAFLEDLKEAWDATPAATEDAEYPEDYGEDCALRTPGNPRFLALLDEMRALHIKKAADYGSNVDPLANIRAAVDYGDNPAKAVAVRLGDKLSRLKAWARSGKLANEGLLDTFMDIACYGLIGYVMAEEYGDDPASVEPTS